MNALPACRGARALLHHTRRYATTALPARPQRAAVRLTKKQKKAWENSRALVESLAKLPTTAKPVPVPPPEPSTDAPPSTPTLETLTQYRPVRPPPLGASLDKYTREYTRAYARLDKAFIRDQLWLLWTELAHAEDGLPKLAAKAGKRQIIQCLLEQWGWPRIEQLERERQHKKWKNIVVEKDIPMTHAEAYLLLRRDPDFSRDLVARHRVLLTMVTRPALCFRVKGRNWVLQDVEHAIDARRKTINTRRLVKSAVPGATLSELYQPISDISGAFLESAPDDPSTLLISYIHPSSLDRALHLLEGAAVRGDDARKARLLALIGLEQAEDPTYKTSSAVPETYALYPFHNAPAVIPGDPTSLGNIPGDWMTTTAAGAGAGGKNLFRVQRLGGWFGSVGHPEEGPAARAGLDIGRVLARDAKSRKYRKYALLRDWLKEARTEEDWGTHQYERHISVQPGHVVFRSPGAQTPRLTPPPDLQGDHSLGSVCRRLLDSEMVPVFIPLSSVPFNARVEGPVTPRRVRRVRYRSTTARVEEAGWTCTVDVEVELPPADHVSVETDAVPARHLELVARQTYRRSWNVMCPDSDRDLSIQEQVSRTLDLQLEAPELRDVIDSLKAEAERGAVPFRLELGELGSFALAEDDIVVASSMASKDAVSSSIDTVEASRTFSSAGTSFRTMAAFENLNSALRANEMTLGSRSQ